MKKLSDISEEELYAKIGDKEHMLEVKKLLVRLAPDPVYTKILFNLISTGIETRNFVHWFAKELKPKKYLEVGVRRGWSTCMVAAASPDCEIYAFDMWQENYGGSPNPGPSFVVSELEKFDYKKEVHFHNGDSHKTLKEFFKNNPNEKFDLVLVDGDHSTLGAWDDLQDLMPHINDGGVMLFDDLADYAGLLNLWKKDVPRKFPNFKYFSYIRTKPGMGVAFKL